MPEFEFSQNIDQFDQDVQEARRKQITFYIVAVLLSSLIFALFPSTGPFGLPRWLTVPIAISIGTFPTALLIHRQFRQQRGCRIIFKELLIQQKSPRHTREIYFHEIKRVFVFRDKKSGDMSLMVMRGTLGNMTITHQDQMEEIVALLRARMPDSAEIVEPDLGRFLLRYFLALLTPFIAGMLIVLFNTHWRGVPLSIDLLFTALLLPSGIWMLFGGLTQLQKYFFGKQGILWLRILEGIIGVVALSVLFWFGINDWRFTSITHSCGVLAGQTSGCYRFIERADEGFDFAGSSNGVLFNDSDSVKEIKFGRFYRGWSSTLIDEYGSRQNTVQSSSDGERFLTTDHRSVSVWSRADASQPLWQQDSSNGRARSLSHDGTLVAIEGGIIISGDEETRSPVRVWRVDDSAGVAQYAQAERPTFVANNRLIYVDNQNRQLVLADPLGISPVKRARLPDAFNASSRIESSADGETLLLFFSNEIAVYSATDLSLLSRVVLRTPADVLSGAKIAFSAETNRLFVISNTASHRTNSANGVIVYELNEGDAIELRVFDTASGALLRKLRVVETRYAWLQTVHVSDDGSTVGITTNEGLFLYKVADLPLP